MKILNLYITETQREALTKLSKKLDLSIAEIVRRAIDAYLKKK